MKKVLLIITIILSIIIVLLLASALITSLILDNHSNIPANGVPSETTPDETTTAPVPSARPDGTVAVIEKGHANYSIIYPENPTPSELSAAERLRDTVEIVTGRKLNLKNDWIPDINDLGNDDCEILIGKVNRPASTETVSALTDLTFTIKVTGNKIIIAGSNESMTALAVEYFIKNYIKVVNRLIGTDHWYISENLSYVSQQLDYSITDIISSRDSFTAASEELSATTGTDGYTMTEGGCSDGEYYYFIMENTLEHRCRIYKQRLSDREIVSVSSPLSLDRAADMTYNNITGQIIVVHREQNPAKVSVINRTTLSVVNSHILEKEISNIAFDGVLNRYFAVLFDKSGYVVLNSGFKITETRKLPANVLSADSVGGLESDGKFIYFLCVNPNMIVVCDVNGVPVNKTELDISGRYLRNISITKEYFIIGTFDFMRNCVSYKITLSK